MFTDTSMLYIIYNSLHYVHTCIDDFLKVTENLIFGFADDTTVVTSYRLRRDSHRDEVEAKRELFVNSIKIGILGIYFNGEYQVR